MNCGVYSKRISVDTAAIEGGEGIPLTNPVSVGPQSLSHEITTTDIDSFSVSSGLDRPDVTMQVDNGRTVAAEPFHGFMDAVSTPMTLTFDNLHSALHVLETGYLRLTITIRDAYESAIAGIGTTVFNNVVVLLRGFVVREVRRMYYERDGGPIVPFLRIPWIVPPNVPRAQKKTLYPSLKKEGKGYWKMTDTMRSVMESGLTEKPFLLLPNNTFDRALPLTWGLDRGSNLIYRRSRPHDSTLDITFKITPEPTSTVQANVVRFDIVDGLYKQGTGPVPNITRVKIDSAFERDPLMMQSCLPSFNSIMSPSNLSSRHLTIKFEFFGI